MSNNGITARVFLVGCARSGTTLLQALLASHPSIASFPETQYFSILVGQGRERVYGAGVDGRSSLRDTLKKLRLAAGVAWPRSGKAHDCVGRLLRDMGHEPFMRDYPGSSMTLCGHARGFQHVLDALAGLEDKIVWLEKSPSHLYYIDEIERCLDDPRFIHLVRNGQDVIASIYDAAQKYSGGHDFRANVDDCIARWNSAATISRSVQGRANHLVVRYENLVENSEQELRRIVDFLAIPYKDGMLCDYASSAKSLIRDKEQWKASVSEGIQTDRSGKFFELFDEKTRAHILSRLVDFY